MGDQRRQPHQRRAPATVTRTFLCPRCGRPGHARAECDAGIIKLDANALTRLRQALLEEVGHALLVGADREHLDGVVNVLRGVEARIAREHDAPMPTLTRRQLISSEKRPTMSNAA